MHAGKVGFLLLLTAIRRLVYDTTCTFIKRINKKKIAAPVGGFDRMREVKGGSFSGCMGKNVKNAGGYLQGWRGCQAAGQPPVRMSDRAQSILFPISLVKSRQRRLRSSISSCAHVQDE